jgi:hypothetical protein
MKYHTFYDLQVFKQVTVLKGIIDLMNTRKLFGMERLD